MLLVFSKDRWKLLKLKILTTFRPFFIEVWIDTGKISISGRTIDFE